MSLQNRCLALAAGMLGAVSQLSAQSKVAVRLTHPAGLGHVLAGKRVVIGPVSGDCSREFLDLLEPDLASHGVFVVPRAELEALLAEHHLQIGSPIDPGTAAQLAKLLGPAVMLTAGISWCDASRREALRGVGLPAPFISRVDGHFLAQVHVIDLANGREVATRTLRAEAYKENQSHSTVPEYPQQSEVKAMTLAKALAEAQHMYFPWIESRELPFMDSKECNLRAAFELLKAGDYDGALRLSRENASACKAGSKTAAGAWYNLGITLMLKRNYEDALSAFDQAQKLNSKGFVAGIIADCQRDKALADAAKPPPAYVPSAPEVPVQTGILLTNDLIVKMVQGNMAEEEIVKMIRTQPVRFALGPDDLRKLKEAGAPDAVVAAMLNKK
jgi:tetratricopeptide (TPR) repeat protein